jgi:glucose-1-phosphate thymidylyltransferase
VKGILLAGGNGTRLRPMTLAVCKQLLPVFDKPMVFYPLTLLMLAGVREVAVISSPDALPALRRLLGDGAAWGMRFAYLEQQAPRGIAEAPILAEDFLAGGPSALVLGDNLLFGQGLSAVLRRAAALDVGARIFGYPVKQPERYGVLAFEGDRVVDVVEKPAAPPSRLAVPGVYFYDGTAPARARALRPSARGELEITDLNRGYLADGTLGVDVLGRGVAWLDMGTPEDLLEAAHFVETLQARQGYRIGCPEEVAWRQGWIDDAGLLACAKAHAGTAYGDYLARLATEEPR